MEKSRENKWLDKYLDTMGAAYLIKLIRDNTASVEDIRTIHRILRHKINKDDIWLCDNVLHVGQNSIVIPQILLWEIMPEDVDAMFEQ